MFGKLLKYEWRASKRLLGLLTLAALYAGYRFLGILGMILFPIGTIMVKQFWNHPETRAAD